MVVSLKSIKLPTFGVPLALPTVPADIYEKRVSQLIERSESDWVVVYADREHHANMAFLTGFEPRFEEALLVLGPNRERILVVGNESQSYAPLAGLPGITIVLNQSMSLLGQDRTVHPSLVDTLKQVGIKKGSKVGIAGWKYLTAPEWDGALPSFFVSAYLIDALVRVVGDRALLSDVTDVLMSPQDGLRCVVDVHQIAINEWGASRSSDAVWRVLEGAAEGETEFAIAARMGYAGEVLTAHMMMASSSAGNPVVGLRSPTSRIVGYGDGVTTAVSYWGGLSTRAGLLSRGDDGFLEIAKAYFEGLVAWYQTTDIGVEGGIINDAVEAALARNNLKPALNPGHLVGYDEWVSTPIRPGSTDRIVSGMPFQVDIIPTPVPGGQALNCEDAVVIADEDLRDLLRHTYPDVAKRIDDRRVFMRDSLGVDLKTSILPLSNSPLALPPFWLATDQLLTLA
ncbi:M24 family metallopeptidase [Rhizobium leguminosarum]|nr:M24 family metallopeptidase [Rhizobium leguminosarum]